MGSTAKELRIFPSAESLGRAAALEFLQRATDAVFATGVFRVVLSGGSTPKAMYSLLATEDSFRSRVPWKKIHFFWGDERFVPPSHQDSNYRMTAEAMLSKVAVPPKNIHRVSTEVSTAEEAASLYEEELRQTFRLAPGDVPRFDLVFLGLGPDGHTASLFPGTSAVHESARLAVAPWVEKFKTFRITLTPVVLNNSACIVFLVVGEDKAEALKEVLEGSAPVDRYPAKVIQPRDGKLLWLVDRAAAGSLSSARAGP